MNYESVSIKRIINDIDENQVYLPALQRKFVWNKPQIQLFFDSIMRNFPIGTFLFWKLPRRVAENYVFYEFLKEYDQRNPYNRRKTGAFLREEIIGVLDGQQRLNSIYVGLMGTHTERVKYKHSSSPSAWPKTELFLNLLSLPYEKGDDDKIQVIEDQNFEFRFLAPESARSSWVRKSKRDDQATESMFWLKVGDVLRWDEDLDIDHTFEKLVQQCVNDPQVTALTEKKRVIQKGIRTLHDQICKEKLLPYFTISKPDLEDILKIFVRVNSGGTTLSKTDLLFSTIVATWSGGRERIESLQKEINAGNRFNFGTEYLMRCCLMLTDVPVVYKVKSFRAEYVKKIQTAWPQIAAALHKTADLLVEFGFDASLLSSQNATIIIAYYIYNGGELDDESKAEIRKYLVHALLNRIYGSSQDQLLRALRNEFREEQSGAEAGTSHKLKNKRFSFDSLLEATLPGRKSLAVSTNDIDVFLEYKKGAASFSVLTLLYPNLRYRDQVFHQDHIHPAAHFTNAKFAELEIPPDKWQDWMARRDTIPNLQLLNGHENLVKNKTPLSKWIEEMSDEDRTRFRVENYFPEAVDLAFSNFEEFYDQRRQLLRAKLHEVLAVMSDVTVLGAEDRDEVWEDVEDEPVVDIES